MQKYKVLVEFEIEGVAQAVDSVIELSDESAAEYISDGRVELVAEENSSEEGADSSEAAA